MKRRKIADASQDVAQFLGYNDPGVTRDEFIDRDPYDNPEDMFDDPEPSVRAAYCSRWARWGFWRRVKAIVKDMDKVSHGMMSTLMPGVTLACIITGCLFGYISGIWISIAGLVSHAMASPVFWISGLFFPLLSFFLMTRRVVRSYRTSWIDAAAMAIFYPGIIKYNAWRGIIPIIIFMLWWASAQIAVMAWWDIGVVLSCIL